MATAKRRPEQPVTLEELRRRFDVTQSAVSVSLGTSQPSTLRIERSADSRVSTVRRYVEALGRAAGVPAELEVVAVVDGQRYVLGFPDRADQSGGRRAAGEERGEGPRAWRLRAWSDPDLEQQLLDRSIIAITQDEFGDLTAWPGDEAMRETIADRIYDTGPQGVGLRLRYLKDFRFGIEPGDVVVVPLAGRRVGVAEVTSDYRYVADEPEPRLRHQRSVRWRWIGSRDRLPADVLRTTNAPGTIASIKSDDAAAALLKFGS